MNAQSFIDWTKGNLAKFDATVSRLFAAYQVADTQSKALVAAGGKPNQVLLDRAKQTLMYIAKLRNGLDQFKPFVQGAIDQNMSDNGLGGLVAPIAGVVGTAYAANTYVKNVAVVLEKQNAVDAQALQLVQSGTPVAQAQQQAGTVADNSLISPSRFSPAMLIFGGLALIYVLG